jgi:type II secretory pathway pseudopilin PulG
MRKYTTQQNGYILLGVFLAVVIIAALVYSSSFFWLKTKESENKYKNVQKQLDNIRKQVDKSNQLILENLENNSTSTILD